MYTTAGSPDGANASVIQPQPLPIVSLAVRSYKHEHYGIIENPKFTVVGWDGAGVQIVTPTVKDEMDDEIPF